MPGRLIETPPSAAYFNERPDSNAALTDVPSVWSAYLPIIAGVLRAILAALGAAGFTWANTVTGSQIEMAVGAAMMLGAAGWSAFQKIQAIRKSQRESVASAVESARATQLVGEPVAVVVGAGPTTTTTVALVATKNPERSLR